MKRTFSFVMALLMLCAMLPMSALAADPNPNPLELTIPVSGLADDTKLVVDFAAVKDELAIPAETATTNFTITPAFDGQTLKATVAAEGITATKVITIAENIDKDVSAAAFTPTVINVTVDWAADAAAPVTPDATELAITGLKNFPAKYTLTLDANGGKVEPATVEAAEGTAWGTLPTPTREGYTFKGWMTEKDGSTVFDGNAPAAANATAYAKWEIKSYTVTVKIEGQADTTQTVNHGADASLPTIPAKTGHTAKWDKDGKNITADTTITAVYTPNRYEIKYMDGTTLMDTGKYTYGEGVAEGGLLKGSKTGHKFIGWYSDKELKNEVKSISGTNTGEVTLYAKWEVYKYTVEFDVNGGNSATPADKVITYGEKYGTLPTPTHATKYFAGWYTKASGGTRVYSTTVMNTPGTHTLYAHWSNVPVTGDDTSVAQIAGLCAALTLSLAGLGAILFCKKRYN